MSMEFGQRFFMSINKLAQRHIPNHPKRPIIRDFGGYLENTGLREFYANDLILGYFIRRTTYHITLVNMFADKFRPGLSFKFHDWDKMMAGPKEKAAWAMLTWSRYDASGFKLDAIDAQAQNVLDLAGEPLRESIRQNAEFYEKHLADITDDLEVKHKLVQPHHPEYWEKIQLMPKLSIVEMAMDYCAMGAERLTRGRPAPAAIEDAREYFMKKKFDKFEWAGWQKRFIDKNFAKLLKACR